MSADPTDWLSAQRPGLEDVRFDQVVAYLRHELKKMGRCYSGPPPDAVREADAVRGALDDCIDALQPGGPWWTDLATILEAPGRRCDGSSSCLAPAHRSGCRREASWRG